MDVIYFVWSYIKMALKKNITEINDGDILAADIYLDRMVLLPKGKELSSSDVNKLMKRGIHEVSVEDDQEDTTNTAEQQTPPSVQLNAKANQELLQVIKEDTQKRFRYSTKNNIIKEIMRLSIKYRLKLNQNDR